MHQESRYNLSIIIPVYNEESYIVSLFKDLEKYFNHDDIEVIVVDDGSNDDSGNILEKLKKKTPGNGFAKMQCKKLIATYKDCINEANLILEI